MVLDFFSTVAIDGFEGFDGDGNPMELELRNSEGGLLATAVAEPATAGLVLLGLCLGLAARRR